MGFNQTDVVDRFDPLPCAAAAAAVCTNDLEIIQHLLHSFMQHGSRGKSSHVELILLKNNTMGQSSNFLFRK